MTSFNRRQLLLKGTAVVSLSLPSCSQPNHKDQNEKMLPTIANVERSAKKQIAIIKATPLLGLQTPINGLNHILGAGQSLSSGFESHPPLTVNAISDGVYSLGDAVQSSNRGAWRPHTSLSGKPATLQPLVTRALAEDTDKILETGAAAALEYRDFTLAEAPIISSVYSFKKRAFENNSDIEFVATESARGGSRISTIVRAQDGRIGRAIAQISDAAKANQTNVRLLWINFVHGQTDEKKSTPPLEYTAGITEHLDAADNFARLKYGQKKPALKMVTQATSLAVLDDDQVPIAQVQLNFARKRKDTVVIAPDFCFQNKSIHLTANGSRMLGEYAAKVADIVINQKKGWVPTQLFKIWSDPSDALTLYATFLAWEPPIRFEKYFHRTKQKMRLDKGVRITDSLGDLDLDGSPEIVGPLTIRIRLSRPLGDAPRFRLCSQKTAGANNICDSDEATGTFNYEFVDGMDEVENIPELVGKPYKLPNFALAEDVPIPYDLEI